MLLGKPCIDIDGASTSDTLFLKQGIPLWVSVAPMIWQPSQLVGAHLGADVTLECNLETHPRGMTFWEKDDGTMLISNAKYDSLVLETGPYRLLLRLTIRNLRPDDFGIYKCVSKNPLGETEATIKLHGEITRSRAARLHVKSSIHVEGQGRYRSAPVNAGTKVKKEERGFTGCLSRQHAFSIAFTTGASIM